MAKGHRSQIKRERNAQKDVRPSDSYLTPGFLSRKLVSFSMPSEAKM